MMRSTLPEASTEKDIGVDDYTVFHKTYGSRNATTINTEKRHELAAEIFGSSAMKIVWRHFHEPTPTIIHTVATNIG